MIHYCFPLALKRSVSCCAWRLRNSYDKVLDWACPPEKQKGTLTCPLVSVPYFKFFKSTLDFSLIVATVWRQSHD
jgi:hypothetical protein